MNLSVFLILLLLFQLFLIGKTIKVKKMSIRYGSLWIFLVILMILLVIFPKVIFKLSNFFGFEATSNMLFLLGFFFLFYIIFILTTSISIQNEKIKLLIQEVSLLKERIDKNGKKD